MKKNIKKTVDIKNEQGILIFKVAITLPNMNNLI